MRQKRTRSNKSRRGRKAGVHSLQQVTLRGLDPRVAAEIQKIAGAENLSLNQAALRLLKKGAGIAEGTPSRTIGRLLDRWIGTWTEEEARELLKAIQSCEQIDTEMWR
jgi:hypothetical protein